MAGEAWKDDGGPHTLCKSDTQGMRSREEGGSGSTSSGTHFMQVPGRPPTPPGPDKVLLIDIASLSWGGKVCPLNTFTHVLYICRFTGHLTTKQREADLTGYSGWHQLPIFICQVSRETCTFVKYALLYVHAYVCEVCMSVFSIGNFQTSNTTLTIVTVLYIVSQQLTHPVHLKLHSL